MKWVNDWIDMVLVTIIIFCVCGSLFFGVLILDESSVSGKDAKNITQGTTTTDAVTSEETNTLHKNGSSKSSRGADRSSGPSLEGRTIHIGPERNVSYEEPPDRGYDDDSDGLTNKYEERIGTDPQSADTDGDGINDWFEVTQTDTYPDADPTTPDVYVEVDYTQRRVIDLAELRQVSQMFMTPSDRGEPVRVHFIIDEQVEEHDDEYDIHEAGDTICQTTFDHEGSSAYIHMVQVPNVLPIGEYDTDSIAGWADERLGCTIVETTIDELVAHEITHMLGVEGSSQGVDSEMYTANQYPSVMNYNYDVNRSQPLRLANGTESNPSRDDWAVIRSQFNDEGSEEKTE